jgi:hypothetical protein
VVHRDVAQEFRLLDLCLQHVLLTSLTRAVARLGRLLDLFEQPSASTSQPEPSRTSPRRHAPRSTAVRTASAAKM